MKKSSSFLGPVQVLLSGLGLLAACGGGVEAGTAPVEESVGVSQEALCSGLSVTNLAISDASSYGGELGAVGTWGVSLFANAVRLEYYVDGTLRSYDERPGTSGTWYHSSNGLGCGSHTLKVRAYPMVIDSNNNKTTCLDSVTTATTSFTQACPSASLSCSRSGDYIVCNGSGSGGSGSPYSSYWQFHAWNDSGSEYTSSWSTGTGSRSFYCPSTTVFFPADWLDISFKVQDSSGMQSPVATEFSFLCEAGTYFEVPPGW